MHKAVAFFKLCVLDLTDLQVRVLLCVSARHSQHNSYKP